MPSGNPQPNADQDYRLNFNIEQLKLPPPPPPPQKPIEETSANTVLTHPSNSDFSKPLPVTQPTLSKSPRKNDNIESIDMDLSDDDVENKLQQTKQNDNLKVIVDNSVDEPQFSLEPPPPLPDLPDDVDANNFLDDLSNELHEFSNLSDELSNSNSAMHDNSMWSQQPLVPPPMMNFGDMISPQLTPMNPPLLNSPMNPPLLNPPPLNTMNPPPLNTMNPPPLNPSMNAPPLNSPMNPPPLNSPMNPPPFNPPMNPPPLNPPMNPPPLNQPMNPMNHPMNSMNPPMHPPPNSMMHPPPMPPLLPPPQPQLANWMEEEEEEEKNPWLEDNYELDEENDMSQIDWSQDRPNNWMGPPNNNVFGGRGRGFNRGGFNPHFNKSPRERGRGRGAFNRGGGFNPGGNMFRGGRGIPRGNRGHRARGNFWGNFRGGF